MPKRSSRRKSSPEESPPRKGRRSAAGGPATGKRTQKKAAGKGPAGKRRGAKGSGGMGRDASGGRGRRQSAPRQSSEATGLSDTGRLQKVLAGAGFGSRRQCEELILAGRVEIDREVVTTLGTKVQPLKQEIRVDGQVLRRPKLEYYAVNKPDGVICTNRDPGGRRRVVDLMPNKDVRLFTVGRLDLHSEGLILLTNDGELANQLTHPRYGVAKVYRVMVAGIPEPEEMGRIAAGVYLAEGFVRPERIVVRSRYKKNAILEITLREGRNREIRRMLARVGHKVLHLMRISIGPVRLGKLAPGETRRLTSAEVKALYASVCRSDE